MYEYWNDFEYRQYYKNYLLDVDSWELTKKDRRVLDCAIWLVDNKSTIRKVSREFGISKSQLQRDMQNTLRKLSYELYQCVQRQIRNNIEIYR